MKPSDRAALRASLLTTLQDRPAMGEASLLAWARRQRPPIGPSTAETVALALVAEGLASREERPDGTAIYRPVQRAPEAPPVEPSPSPTPPPVSAVRAVRPPPPAPAPAPTPEQIVRATLTKEENALLDASRQLARVGAERDALAAERDSLREQLGRALASGAEWQRRALAAEAAPTPVALGPRELARAILDLPLADWRALCAAKRDLDTARDLRARSAQLEASAREAGDRALGQPPAATIREKILALLAEHKGALPTAEIADRIGSGRATVGSILSQMTRRGEIERPEPSHYQARGRRS